MLVFSRGAFLSSTRSVRTVPPRFFSFQRSASSNACEVDLADSPDCAVERDFEDFVTFPNGAKMKYRMKGSGPYTVVMNHGSPGNYADFKHLIPLIDPKIRVLSFDLPGFGESCANAADVPAESGLAGGVWKALDTLCIHDKVVLLGHSFGGQTVLHMANQRPERVGALAFLSTPGLRPHKAFAPYLVNSVTTNLVTHPLTEKPSMALLLWWYKSILKFPSSIKPEAVLSATLRFNAVRFETIREELVPKVSHFPTLCAYAKDDHLIQTSIFEEYANTFANGPRLRFDRGGHNIQKTHAKTIAETLNEWIPHVCDKN